MIQIRKVIERKYLEEIHTNLKRILITFNVENVQKLIWIELWKRLKCTGKDFEVEYSTNLRTET